MARTEYQDAKISNAINLLDIITGALPQECEQPDDLRIEIYEQILKGHINSGNINEHIDVYDRLILSQISICDNGQIQFDTVYQ